MATTSTAAPSVKFSFPTYSPLVVRCDRRLALSADIEGTPSPHVRWFLNRTPLAADSDGPEYRLNTDRTGARYCTAILRLIYTVCPLTTSSAGINREVKAR